MRCLVIKTPRGNLRLEQGATAPRFTVSTLIRWLAEIFDYTAILTGSTPGELIDENDFPLHPQAEVLPGEYTLRVITRL